MARRTLTGAVLVAFAAHQPAVALGSRLSALSGESTFYYDVKRAPRRVNRRRLQGCEDIAGWTDADGHTCAFYATNGWCCSEEAGPHCDAALFDASLGQLDQTDGCCGSCSAECVDNDAAADAVTGGQGYDCAFIGANGACPQLEAMGVASMCGCACAPSLAPEPEPELVGFYGFRASLVEMQGTPALNHTQCVLQYSQAAMDERPYWSDNPVMKTMKVIFSQLGLYGDPSQPEFPHLRLDFLQSVGSIWFLTWNGIHTRTADMAEMGHGGAFYMQQSQVEVHSCLFRGMYAQTNGGAIYVASSNLEIQNSLFDANRAQAGGGIYMTRSQNNGSMLSIPQVIINATTFLNNVAYEGTTQSSGSGGAILAGEADMQIQNTNFSNNRGSSGENGDHRSVTGNMIGGDVLWGEFRTLSFSLALFCFSQAKLEPRFCELRLEHATVAFNTWPCIGRTRRGQHAQVAHQLHDHFRLLEQRFHRARQLETELLQRHALRQRVELHIRKCIPVVHSVPASANFNRRFDVHTVSFGARAVAR